MTGIDQRGRIGTASGAKVGSQLTVDILGTPTVVECARDLTVASGDIVVIVPVGDQWYAVARAYAAAPAAVVNPTPPPSPKPTVVTGTTVVTPTETRSYRPSYGWRSDNTDVYQGSYGGWGNHTGAVFYGGRPRSLAGATVTSARIQVRRETGGAYAPQATTMRLMTNSSRPGGAPTLTSTTSGPSIAVGATSSGFTVPTAWAQALVDGTAGGLAFFDADGSPYVRFAGRGTWSPAFSLTINWQRG